MKHETKLLKFTELHFSFIAAQMLCKLLRGMKQNGIYSEIFGACFCLDRNFQLGCCQNKADRITGVGHLLDIWWLFIVLTEFEANIQLLISHNIIQYIDKQTDVENKEKHQLGG